MVFPFIVPALIGAAATIGGGMIAQNAQNKAERNWNRRADAARDEPQIITNTVDLRRMREDAEAAGFNPLSVLRAGGLAAYNVQQHPNLHPLPNVNHGASPMGNAISGLGSQIFGLGADIAMAGVNAGHQQSLLASAGFAGMPGGAPVSMSYDGPMRQSSGGALSPAHLGMPSSDQWEQEIPGVTNPYHEIFNWESNPYAADIETGAEARYGDFMSIPDAVLVRAMDVGWNVNRFGNYVHNELGPQFRNVIQSWAAEALSPLRTGGGLSVVSGDPTGSAPPMSITVTNKNQPAWTP